MTTREHFAGMAMQGLLATYSGNGIQHPDEKYIARASVKYAEALIAKLAETTEKSLPVQRDTEWERWKVGEIGQWFGVAEGNGKLISTAPAPNCKLIADAHNAEMKRVTGKEGK